MVQDNLENPWSISSIFELLFYNCPSCKFKHNSKQTFVDHAIDNHPEAANGFTNINDGSLADVEWNPLFQIKVEEEEENQMEEKEIFSHFDEEQMTIDETNLDLIKDEVEHTESDLRLEISSSNHGNDQSQNSPTKAKKGGRSKGRCLEPMKCPKCQEEFNFYSDLVQHLLLEHLNSTKETSTQCDQCYEDFPHSEALIDHIFEVHFRTCGLCLQDGFQDVQSLLQHLEHHHERLPFACLSCNLMLKNGKFKAEHMKSCDETYKCALCLRDFTTYPGLQYHIKSEHRDNARIECKHCDMTFASKGNLKNHVKLKHSENDDDQKNHKKQYSQSIPHICPHCKKEFDKYCYLVKHLIFSHEVISLEEILTEKQNQAVCNQCSLEFHNKDAFTTHFMEVHFRKCGYCLKSCQNVPELVKHFDQDHKTYLPVCFKCEIVFATKKRKEDHMQECEESCYKCQDCQKDFKSVSGIFMHIQTNHGKIQPHECSQCDKKFASRWHLQMHIKKIHEGQKMETFTCDKCGKILNSRSGYLQHMKYTHDYKAREFECEKCRKKFHIMSTLKKHYRTVHENKKDFQCDICGDKFTVKAACERHIQAIHAKEKNFKCEICGQAFLDATILKRHFDRIHATGPKKFQCDLCPKSFVLNYALKCHKQKIHEKVINFKCEDCGKGFFYNYEYLAHVKVVHKGEMKFKCHTCDKQFVRPGYLKIHINSAH